MTQKEATLARFLVYKIEEYYVTAANEESAQDKVGQLDNSSARKVHYEVEEL